MPDLRVLTYVTIEQLHGVRTPQNWRVVSHYSDGTTEDEYMFEHKAAELDQKLLDSGFVLTTQSGDAMNTYRRA